MERRHTHSAPARVRGAGFTLIELLVSTVVLLIVMGALFQITASVAGIWKSSSGKTSAFQSARAAFSTLNQTLARATLNTYNDYVDTTSGTYAFRVATDTNFKPTQFARASELHFLSGPTAEIAAANQTKTNSAALGSETSSTVLNPGDAVFFQAAQGDTNSTNYSVLNRSINSIGFYIQYGKLDNNLVPTWLANSVVATRSYRYRLLEFVEPTESLQVYASTGDTSGNYLLDWLKFASITRGSTTVDAKARPRVLAENVVLLVLRPRLSPKDEAKVSTDASSAPSATDKLLTSTYDPQKDLGAVLSPNYHYDSRAWQANYPAGGRVNAMYSNADFVSASRKRAQLMCNQLPPIYDVAMVCADEQSLARFDLSSSTPPTQLQVPNGSDGKPLFSDSTKMEADLVTYSTQLSTNHVRYHILRSSLEIQGAKWSNN